MTTDNRTSEPSEEQVEAAARAIADNLFSRWTLTSRVSASKDRGSLIHVAARAALVAAAGVAPPAPSEYAYCPTHGDLLAANRSYRCGNAPTGHEYSRHTIPLYGMLDLWMALYGTSHPQFDEFYEKHGYAETWARLLAEVRSRAAAGAAPQAESEAGKRLSSEFRADLVEAARERIQAVWADLPEGVDAKTLAQNVVSAQEFFWLSLHFPVQPSSGVDEDKLAEVIAKSRGFGNGWEQIPPLTKEAYREVARAVTEWLKEQER